MSNEPKQAENGDRLLCDPWRGARTPEFRKFKRDFKASADALFLHEDDYSVWQAMADADQGGRAQNADARGWARRNSAQPRLLAHGV